MTFEGKAAVVAGGGGGMGLRVAKDLLAAGARVAVMDVKPAPDELKAAGEAARYHQGDVTEEDFVRAVIDGFAAESGRLDCLVNCTGVLWFDKDKSCTEMEMDVWDRVLAVNLKSFALTARYAVPQMKKSGGGTMVHIASVDALRGDDRPQDAYGAAKAGVLRLSKSLAVQFARDKIRSNAILPGPVVSPMQARWEGDSEALEAISAYVPLGRPGAVQDIANAVLFLLSDKASFITGTELIVDGGCMAKP